MISVFNVKICYNDDVDNLKWVTNYDVIPMDEHNSIGAALTEKVKIELGRDVPMVFIQQ